MMKSQAVYVILVALDNKKFDHFYNDPKVYYETKADAEYIRKQLIDGNIFQQTQLKIQQLWMLKKKHS